MSPRDRVGLILRRGAWAFVSQTAQCAQQLVNVVVFHVDWSAQTLRDDAGAKLLAGQPTSRGEPSVVFVSPPSDPTRRSN